MKTMRDRLRSDSGMEDEREGDEFEVIVLSVGLPVNGRPYSTTRRERQY